MGRVFYTVGIFKAALAVARVLPRPLAHAVASVVGRIGYGLNAEGRAGLESNLERVTGSTGGGLRAHCLSNVRHFSRMLADYFLCAGQPERAGTLLDQWLGIENLEAALARGKGVILITAHLGNWEMGGTLLALRGLPMSIITLEEPSDELSRWRQDHRRRLGIKTITVGPGHDFAFVEMMQALRRNEILAMLVDRPYPGSGLPVEFFGGTTEFSSGPALLWQHTGAAVVPAFVLLNSNARYVSSVDPMLPLVSEADPRVAQAANTQRIATYFESIIRQHPRQWFNYVPIWTR
jgi:lauroyl/myristoyl acyltransferase